MSLIEFPNEPYVPYKKMYTILFNAITDALDIMQKDSLAASILMEAQQKTEEMYISADPKARKQKDNAKSPECKSQEPEANAKEPDDKAQKPEEKAEKPEET